MATSNINVIYRNFEPDKKPTRFVLPDNVSFNFINSNKLTVNNTLQVNNLEVVNNISFTGNATGYFGTSVFTNNVYLPVVQSATVNTIGPGLVLDPSNNLIQQGLGTLTYNDYSNNNPFDSMVSTSQYNNYVGAQGTQYTAVYSNVEIDPNFSPGRALNNYTKAVAQLNDGRVVVGGLFNDYNGNITNYLAVLNSDGSLNTSFNPGFDNYVRAIKTQIVSGDEKIIIAGNFQNYDGSSFKRIVRLNHDLTTDGTFNIGNGFNNNVWCLAIQSDNKILVSGEFTQYDGNTSAGLIRLNEDGSYDNTFIVPGTGFNGRVQKVIVLSNGQILCGGAFTDYNGTPIGYIARLNSDGTLDTSFNQGTGFNDWVIALAETSDNKYLVGGQFDIYNGVNIGQYFARLNNDGTLDTTLNTGSGFSNYVNAIVIDNNGDYILGGWFNGYNGSSVNYICKLNPNGDLDTNFGMSYAIFNDMIYDLILVDNNTSLFAVGNFEFKYVGNGKSYYYIVKLNISNITGIWILSVPFKTTSFLFEISLDGSGNITYFFLRDTINWDNNEITYQTPGNFIVFSSPNYTISDLHVNGPISSNGNACTYTYLDPWASVIGFNSNDYGTGIFQLLITTTIKLR